MDFELNDYQSFYSFVDIEKYLFLNKLTDAVLLESTPLDQIRQGLMRIAIVEKLFSIEEAVNFCINENKIIELRDYLKEYFVKKRVVSEFLKKEKVSHKDFVSQIGKVFSEHLLFDDSSKVCLANQYGFAAFQRGETLAETDTLRVVEVNNWKESSTELLMFYGFNDERYQKEFFIQKKPIELLSFVFKELLHKDLHDSFQCDWSSTQLVKEIQSLPVDITVEEIENSCYEFLIGHELGHFFVYKNAEPIKDLILSSGYDLEDAYLAEFPSEFDFNSWKRVKSGTPSLRDVTFLYGDLFSNITMYSGGISNPSLVALRAFNWWLSSPPSLKKRPRGNIVFLAYSYTSNFDLLLGKLREIIDSIKENPKMTADLMLKLEFESWKMLQERFRK